MYGGGGGGYALKLPPRSQKHRYLCNIQRYWLFLETRVKEVTKQTRAEGQTVYPATYPRQR